MNFFAKRNTILLLYVYHVFIFLQDHLHFFLQFFFTLMEQLFLDDPISRTVSFSWERSSGCWCSYYNVIGRRLKDLFNHPTISQPFWANLGVNWRISNSRAHPILKEMWPWADFPLGHESHLHIVVFWGRLRNSMRRPCRWICFMPCFG